jgi:hypothetical protein
VPGLRARDGLKMGLAVVGREDAVAAVLLCERSGGNTVLLVWGSAFGPAPVEGSAADDAAQRDADAALEAVAVLAVSPSLVAERSPAFCSEAVAGAARSIFGWGGVSVLEVVLVGALLPSQ